MKITNLISLLTVFALVACWNKKEEDTSATSAKEESAEVQAEEVSAAE